MTAVARSFARTFARRAMWGALALAPSVGHAQDRGDDPAGAARYFLQQRADAAGRIPPRARTRALEEMRQRWPQSRLSRFVAAGTAAPSSTTWTPLGPAPLGSSTNPSSGRLNTIAVHPTDPQTLYVGGAQGGVWKTVNGGASWAPLTDSQCSLAMGSVVLDPVDPRIVYAGTGEENNSGDSYYGCGVLRSIDAGATWQQLGGDVFDTPTGGARIARLIIDKSTAGNATTTVLYAATTFGLYRSQNSGQTWTRNLTGVASDVVMDPSQPGVVYAGISRVGISKSTDGGVTWTPLAGGLPTTGMGRVNLAIAPSDPNTLYASFGNAADGVLLGFYRTTDAGVTWTKQTATGASCNSQCWYDMAIAVDPASPLTVIFGGFSVYRSIDGGISFGDIGRSVHVDHHAAVFDPLTPGTLYVGSDGGIWKSTDVGNTWTNLNTNLALTQFYQGVSINPLSATDIIGGTQDNGTVEWNGVSLWPSVIGGDGGYTAIDYRTGTTAYGETQWTAGTQSNGPRRRDPGSTFFLSRTLGINLDDRAQFIPPLVMEPTTPSVLYFGTFMLYRTDDRGNKWASVSPDLSRTGSATISAIAVSPIDSQTIFVGTSDGNVQVTSNLGRNWVVSTAGLPTRFVSDFALEPRDPRTAWVVVGGFGSGHVFRTTDRGATWTNVSFDLPDVPVLSVVLQPGSGELDIGTDLGVFSLAASATTWQPVTNGLPNVSVYDVAFDKARSRLIAATHGRGMFSLDVSVTGLRGDITKDGVISALDAQAILSSVVGLPLPAGAVRYPNGDANCDGDVTAADALIVLSRVVGAPVGSACVGTVK